MVKIAMYSSKYVADLFFFYYSEFLSIFFASSFEPFGVKIAYLGS